MTEYVFRIHDRRGCGEPRGEREAFRQGFGRHEHGCGPEARFERGFGGRREHRHGRGRERMFDAGDVKLVILKLLSEQPSYGYQLIKTMEERLAGGYAPSPGVIYPTLTMLEEEGLAASPTENNKKVYSVTPEGTEYLEENKRRVEGLIRASGGSRKGLRARPLARDHEGVSQSAGAVVARVIRGRV